MVASLPPLHAGSRLLATLLLVGLLFQAATTQAQITLDGTIKPGAQKGSLTGAKFEIPFLAGEMKGNNLFHSFGQFNVLSGETATFHGPASIANIINRVTGGERSSIFGKIDSKTDMPTANFFLLNPSGVLIGAGAQLNIGGAFSVSTAGCLRATGANCLGPDDGTKLKLFVDPSKQSVLTADTPAAFGFLGSNPPVRIAVEQGSVLQVSLGKTLSVVGGDAPFLGELESGLKITGSTLRALGGKVQIVSAASAGEVVFDPNLSISTGMRLGKIDISGNSLIDVNSPLTGPIGSGTVVIRGGSVMVDGPKSPFNLTIRANNATNVDGASLGIDLQATDDLVIADRVLLLTETSGNGNAGGISLMANTLKIDNSLVRSRSLGGGQGGTISATASGSVGSIDIRGPCNMNSCGILTQASGVGDAGDVTLNAHTLSLSGVNISSRTDGAPENAAARGGDIELKVGDLSVEGGATIQSTRGNSLGRGGDVTVPAANSVTLSGRGSGIFVDDQGTKPNRGRPGDVWLDVRTLSLKDGAVIQSGTPVTTGGNVTVTARDSVIISGGSGISSQAFDHDAGRVRISKPSTLIVDNGFIDTSTRGGGAAGDISVEVGSLTLAGGAQIASSSLDPQTTGRGGSVSITADNSVSISGRSSTGIGGVPFSHDASSGLFSTAEGKAPAGEVRLSAQTLTMSDGGKISVSTTGSAPAAVAGNIAVNVGTVALTGGAIIDSSTAGAAHGGTVALTAGSCRWRY